MFSSRQTSPALFPVLSKISASLSMLMIFSAVNRFPSMCASSVNIETIPRMGAGHLEETMPRPSIREQQKPLAPHLRTHN